MSRSKALLSVCLFLVFSLIMPYAPVHSSADEWRTLLHVDLYSDGSVRIRFSRKILLPLNESEDGLYVLNVTFYKDKTMVYHRYLERVSFNPFNGASAGKGSYDFVEVNKDGVLVGNSSSLIYQNGDGWNSSVSFRVFSNSSGKFVWSHVLLTVKGGIQLGPPDIRSIVKDYGGRVIDYHKMSRDGKLMIDAIIVVPYANSSFLFSPWLAARGAHISSGVSLISNDNSVVERLETHMRFNSSEVQIVIRNIYKLNFNEYLKHLSSTLMESNKAAEGRGAQDNITRLLDELAENYIVKTGTSYIEKANDTAYIVETPVIKKKNTSNPLDTLKALRDLAVRTGLIQVNGTLWNTTVILRPGDSGIKSINPSQTTISNLDKVKVTLRNNGETSWVTRPSSIVVLITVVAIILFILARKLHV